MSLLRLLSTGKSLVGLRNQVRPYQVSEEVRLPRFERKSNPFRVTTRPARPVKAPEPATDICKSAQPEPVRTTAPASHSAPASVAGSATAAGKSESAGGGIGKLVRSITAWMHPGKARNLFSRAARPEPVPAQTELRLEAVTVMRNDLSDTDIEVVPRKEPGATTPEPGPKAAPTLPAAPAVPAQAVAESAWGRVSAKVFGTEKVN
jgi:hypothetical protein